MATEAIRYFDRYTREVKTERVYGEAWLRFAYENPVGRFFVWLLARRALFSRWYGWKMNKRVSANQILPFIVEYFDLQINSLLFKLRLDELQNFGMRHGCRSHF